MRWLLALVPAIAASCALDDVDLAGKHCPCSVGWVCDDAANVCVRSLVRPDGAMPIDAGPVSMDATTPDAAMPSRDGGLTDTGPADAPPPDAGFDAGLSPTACDGPLSAAIFCDGFEDGPGFAAWTSGPTARDGAVTWVEDVVYRGGGALRAEITASRGYAFVRTDTSPAVGSGDYWFRAYVRFPSGVALTHFNFGYSAPSGTAGVSYYIQDGRPYAFMEETMTSHPTTVMLPRDVWICLEYHLVVSDTDGAVEIFVDGVSARSMTGVDTLVDAAYDRLAAGITYSASKQGPTTMYLDEVAVGTSRLPCD